LHAQDRDQRGRRFRVGAALLCLNALRGYLTTNAEGLWYRDRLKRGLPIGSGLVEGVCKTVIGRRLKHSGARWHVPNVNAVAALCSLLYSDQSNDFWESKAA